jgi:hypothetical protein
MKKKRFLAWVLLAGLGIFALGCESQPGTTEHKTETKTTQTKDGKTTTTVDTKTTTPATADGRGTTTETTTTKTIETTR